MRISLLLSLVESYPKILTFENVMNLFIRWMFLRRPSSGFSKFGLYFFLPLRITCFGVNLWTSRNHLVALWSILLLRKYPIVFFSPFSFFNVRECILAQKIIGAGGPYLIMIQISHEVGHVIIRKHCRERERERDVWHCEMDEGFPYPWTQSMNENIFTSCLVGWWITGKKSLTPSLDSGCFMSHHNFLLGGMKSKIHETPLKGRGNPSSHGEFGDPKLPYLKETVTWRWKSKGGFCQCQTKETLFSYPKYALESVFERSKKKYIYIFF